MAKIDSKGAREKLPFRRDPYWQRIESGLYVGYRVSSAGGDGSWRGRWRDEDGTQQWRTFDNADFKPDGHGRDTAFIQAVRFAREWQSALVAGVINKPLTVADAVDEYLKAKDRDDDARSIRGTAKARAAFQKHVLSDPVANVELSKLRADILQSWLDRRVIVQGDDPDDPDARRAARNTANRELARLKAVLNFALKRRLVGSDFAWRGVDRFKHTEAKREFVPTVADIAKLMKQATPDMAQLVQLLELTGLRPGEAYKLRVKDYDKASGTIAVSPDTKTGKRTVPVSTDAMQFLNKLAASRIGDALLITRDDGMGWDGNEAAKRFRAIRKAAGLPDEFVLYCLRHRWISEAVARMEVGTVAIIAGTSIEMIQDFYAKLSAERTRADLDRIDAHKKRAKDNG